MGEHPGWMEGFVGVIRGYEKHRPEVEVKLQYQPLDGFAIWLETQFLGGRGPDMIVLGNNIAHRLGARQGMLVPLTEYLDQESPYAKGERWADTMYPIVWQNVEDPIYGETWIVPFNFFALRIFYNKGLFRQVGAETPPKTWTEFIDVQQRLQDAGIVPYLMPNNLNTGYSLTGMVYISDMLHQSLTPKLDRLFVDGKLDGFEHNAGIYQGLINLRDPELLEPFRLLKQWSKYWARGYNGLDRQEAKMLFAQGIGAMYFDGSWEAEALNQAVTFDWGVFSVPTVTKKSSKYADGPRNDSNFNLTFSVGSVARDRGHLDDVIDFLQYLTSPEAADTLTSYVSFVSSLKDYPVPPHLTAYAPASGYPWSSPVWGVAQQTGSTESGDRLKVLVQMYLADELTATEMVDRFEPLQRRLVVEEMRYALSENHKMVKEVGGRLAVLESNLSQFPAARADTNGVDTLAVRRQKLERQVAFVRKNFEKAQAQVVFLTDVLSEPPVWEKTAQSN